MEGDSLLHVVAASGDTQGFLSCVETIVQEKESSGGASAKSQALEARNNEGDTPLHCAAAAGNARMISCLVGLLNADEEKKKFVEAENKCGETALHHAVRRACMMHNPIRRAARGAGARNQ